MSSVSRENVKSHLTSFSRRLYSCLAVRHVTRINQNELGPGLRRTRLGLGKTLAEVAAEVGTSKSYLSQLERGVIVNPKSDMLQRICLALGIEVAFGVSDRPRPGAALAYEPPILLDGPISVAEDAPDDSAVGVLKSALSDSRIPLSDRQLLERQIRALVRAVRDHATVDCS